MDYPQKHVANQSSVFRESQQRAPRRRSDLFGLLLPEYQTHRVHERRTHVATVLASVTGNPGTAKWSDAQTVPVHFVRRLGPAPGRRRSVQQPVLQNQAARVGFPVPRAYAAESSSIRPFLHHAPNCHQQVRRGIFRVEHGRGTGTRSLRDRASSLPGECRYRQPRRAVSRVTEPIYKWHT